MILTGQRCRGSGIRGRGRQDFLQNPVLTTVDKLNKALHTGAQRSSVSRVGLAPPFCKASVSRVGLAPPFCKASVSRVGLAPPFCRARGTVVAEANKTKRVFFVDDEPDVCQAVARTLEQIGLKVRCFTRADDCLEQLCSQSCDLLITDLRMPGIDGMELLMKVKRTMPSLPVLILTGYGDIPTAVKAIKGGAYDFIEKPFSRETLVLAVKSLLEQTKPPEVLKSGLLTPTEVIILRLVLQGKSNREIAELLSRSERTIEWHRSRIMRKLGVDNVIDLVTKAISLGFGGQPPQDK